VTFSCGAVEGRIGRFSAQPTDAMANRITKEEALSFLLTYIVVERDFPLRLNPVGLFEIMNTASRGAHLINDGDDVTPHELLEQLADEYIFAHTAE
jgi:hypothetical protein